MRHDEQGLRIVVAAVAIRLQYIASLPNAWYQEFCEQETILRKTLTTPIFKIDDDGFVHIPMTKGFGIDLNPEAVKKYSVKQV